jgi:hypothetical protein
MTARRLLPLALCLALALAFAPAAVRAADAGAITGQVVAKNGATGIAGTPITLEISTADGGAPDEHTAKAGDDGSFRFDNIPMPAGAVYLLKVVFDGGNYFQEVQFDSGATTAAAPAITVYPATRDARAISFQRFNTIISTVDQNGAQIIETGSYHNGARQAYVGPGAQNGQDATTLRFGLPQDAAALQPAQGLNRDTLVQIDEPPLFGFAMLDAIPPGDQQFAYLYRLAAPGNTITFNRVFPYQTDLYTLYLPAGARLAAGGTGPAFADGGETTLPDGHSYHIYTLSNLAPNTRLTARFTNVSGSDGGNFLWGIGPFWAFLIIVALVVGIGLIAVYGRRRLAVPAVPAGKAARRPRGATTVRTVPAGAAVGSAPTPAVEASAEDLVARRERLINDLADLDDRFETGALPEEEYRRERAARKDELLATLRALEARAGAAPAQSRT